MKRTDQKCCCTLRNTGLYFKKAREWESGSKYPLRDFQAGASGLPKCMNPVCWSACLIRPLTRAPFLLSLSAIATNTENL
jgi:hypothetical protein